ncbi:hypothetical protein ACLEPN_10990 [Myxococcus sp. 1LA]
MRTRTLLLAPLLLSTSCATVAPSAQAPAATTAEAKSPAPERPFGPLREQAKRQQAWLAERVEKALPQLMRQYGVDMWVIPMREYNEDPVFKALVSPTSFAARRRTIYVFFDRGPEQGVERLALGGGSQGGLYTPRRAQRQVDGGGVSREAELWGPSSGRCSSRCWRSGSPSVSPSTCRAPSPSRTASAMASTRAWRRRSGRTG